ncbi:MAG: hypothetical protein NC218_01355 [Acetobacter sp.]|nr:hypothetical protein [Acetobacter sp.]
MKAIKAILYWILHIIWAAPTFLIGAVVSLFMLMTGHKPHRFGCTFYFTVKFVKNCGCEFGPMFVLADNCSASLHMKQHEHGHGIQALIFGPITLFVVSLPSIIRFWYRELKERKMVKKLAKQKITAKELVDWYRTVPEYESIWFEAQATKLGEKYFLE